MFGIFKKKRVFNIVVNHENNIYSGYCREMGNVYSTSSTLKELKKEIRQKVKSSVDNLKSLKHEEGFNGKYSLNYILNI